MKKIVILILMAFVVNVVAFAQTYQEVVYLKNGSVIRGLIVEQIPNVSLKIQTADGSIFAYQMDEVEKITKELAVSSTPEKKKTAFATNGYKMKSGYRGFVEVGYSVRVGDYGSSMVEFLTSHGYQILPSLFAGVGSGLHYYSGSCVFPIYADIRGTIPCHSIVQPFLDYKVGYSVGHYEGLYMSLSIGCRVAVGKNYGISLSAGGAMQWGAHQYICCGSYRNRIVGEIPIRVGFDF